jgi:hypothetical protein
METNHVDHVKIFDYYSKDVKQIAERKDHLLQNWGHVLTSFFEKTGQKG